MNGTFSGGNFRVANYIQYLYAFYYLVSSAEG